MNDAARTGIIVPTENTMPEAAGALKGFFICKCTQTNSRMAVRNAPATRPTKPGIRNGIPLGAVEKVLTRRSYFNTFGGNPVCTAAGSAVLKVIQKEKLQENAHVVGSHLNHRLHKGKKIDAWS
ncbi:hypothetical protein F3Y22_tig00110045pilonHSYRG00036 [Hibiscus syriacus]|uniref:Uncharacterized protein n=1 Tax=Hibiscus syriacus TaxID=106335 RepID=A0A6A3BKB1_HIBSY|nr:hypothetical protein F3Y22_tig00110045pilonHSYRG00036 [Hibiscus syriacus]